MNLIYRYKTGASVQVETKVPETARDRKNANPNARQGEGRWDRLRRLKTEKRLLEEIARATEENAAE